MTKQEAVKEKDGEILNKNGREVIQLPAKLKNHRRLF